MCGEMLDFDGYNASDCMANGIATRRYSTLHDELRAIAQELNLTLRTKPTSWLAFRGANDNN